MAKARIIGHPWEFSKLWNSALDAMPERPLQKREHIWASELGGAFCDRYLKMHAVAYSNPPNFRSRRKFVSGHIWEWIVSIVLTMAGVLKEKQLRGEVELPGLLRVSGKLDFIAGGVIDWEKAKSEVERVKQLFAISVDEMPPFIFFAIDFILKSMEKQFGANPLMEMIFENKAISSFMSEKVEKTGKAMPHHVMQDFHYLLANKDIPEAKLSYICKDDSICHEFQVTRSKELLKMYKEDVATMTGYFQATNKKDLFKTLPPIEPEVLFDETLYRFYMNFKCEYSNYLTMLYRYKTPEDYRMRWSKDVATWNRVFKRCVRGEKMTDKNKIVLRDVVKVFPLWEKFVYKAKSEGAFIDEKDDD